jgi:hypothetical protein
MTKYSTAQQRRSVSNNERPLHPVWRGIGCILILFIPALSFFLAAATVQLAVDQNWPMPYQLLGYPAIPNLLWKDIGIVPLLSFIHSQNNLYAILTVTFVYIVFFVSLVSFGYAFLYRFVGPSRYGPLDAPPPKVKVKRYNR